MASSEKHEPSWLDASNDPKEESTPLMGSGDAPLQDEEKDVEVAAITEERDTSSYGALDIKEDDEESTQKHAKDWDKKAPKPKKQKKKPKKKKVRVSESIHEILVNRPHRSCCLHVFIFIEIVAIIASLCLLTTQIIPIIIAPPSKIGYLPFALRLYLSLFCIVFILVETELPFPLLKDSVLFTNWISRGFLYSFIGLIGMQEAYSSRVEDLVGHASEKFKVSWAPLFMQISSWVMFVTGCVYMLMGMFCLKRVKNRLKENYQERMKEYDSTTVVATSEV